MKYTQILEHLSVLSNITNKEPIIIELAGTPNSGKTSLINSINTSFSRYNVKCKIIRESAQFCKISNKKTPQFNYWTALETLQRILSVIDQGYKVILCDRGVFDAISWMKLYLNNKYITQEDYNIIKNFYLLKEWNQYFYYIIVMTCDADISVQRDLDYNEFEKYGTIVNPNTISEINNAIFETTIEYYNKFNKIEVYDTSNNIEDVKKQVMENVFKYLLSYLQ